MQVFRVFSFLSLFFVQFAFSADYPLYVRFIPYAPPNLHLTSTRATAAYFIPGVTPGTLYNFTLTPVLASTLSLAKGPIPLVLQFYNSPTYNCPGTKVVTATLRYNISGSFITVTSQTKTINILTGFGSTTVQAFAFGGLTATQNYTLQSGDYVQLQIKHESGGSGSACIVNESPLNGTDTDASKITLKTGPMLSIQKLHSLISDPVNGATNPKSIPGATVRYTVNISNDASASDTANSVAFTDIMPSNTLYKPNTLTLNAAPLTDATDGDAGEISGTTVNVNTGTITAGQTATVKYDVTID